MRLSLETVVGSAMPHGPERTRSPVTTGRLENLFLVFLIYGAFEGLLKRLTGFAWYIYPIRDILFLVVVVQWATLPRANPASSRPPLFFLLWLYLALVAVQALNPHLPTVLIWLAGVRTSYMYALLFFVAYRAFGTAERIERLARVVGVLAVITAIGAMIESSLGIEWVYAHKLEVFINASYVGASGQWVIRPSSIGNGPGSAAMMEYIGAMALLGFATGDPRWSRRMAYFFAAGLALGGVLLGATRIIWLQAALAIGIFALVAGPRRFKRATYILVPAGMAVGLSLLFSKGEINSRFETVETPLGTYRAERYGALQLLPRVVADFPLGAGVGWNAPRRDLFAPSYLDEATQYSGVHNYFSNLALEVGIPGLMVFLLFSLGVSMWGLRRLGRERVAGRRALLGACYAVFVSILLSFLAGGAISGWPGEYYWIFAAIVVRTGRLEPVVQPPSGEAPLVA